MKQGTTELIKFRKLMRRLKESQRGIVGLLELLWCNTAKQCPQGDIGRFPDEDIAELVDWDGDPGELVEALVSCGWLDRSEEHRLLVHDWHEHAPSWVTAVLKKKKAWYLTAEATTPDGEPSNEATEVASEPSSEGSSEGSSEPSSDGSTRARAFPNLTKPNLTKPNHTKATGSAEASQDQHAAQPQGGRPTGLEEVQEFAKTEGVNLDCEKFWNHYEGNGWLAGKTKIVDWRAKARQAAGDWCKGPVDRVLQPHEYHTYNPYD